DYRDGGPEAEPRVSMVDFEDNRDELIAPDFATFLSLLEEYLAFDTLGLSGCTLNEAVGALEVAGVRFQPPRPDDRGYPVRRCRLPGARGPKWAWLEPNRVSRGFVRESDPRYADLVDLLPGTALRMPDRPEVDVVLQCTDGIVDLILEAC